MQFQKVFILLGLSLLVISFQNCSEDVVFSSMNADHTLEMSSSGLIDENGPEELNNGNLGDHSEDSQQEVKQDTSESERGCESESKRQIDEELDGLSPNQDDKLSCEYAIRQMDKMINLPEGSSIENLQGTNFFLAKNISEVRNIGGNLFILCLGDDCRNFGIKYISHVHGNITICGLNVHRLSGVNRGNFTITGGDIGDISDFRGNLKLIGGEILGAVDNSRGNIRVFK